MSGYRTGGWFGMVLIGAENEESRNILCSIYNRIPVPEGGKEVSVCCMSPESAEICKLASNCFRTTKISFANMIGDIADRSNGANKYDICDALKCDRSIGPICMTPGYGFGGPCYPRDNKALSLYAKSIAIIHFPTLSVGASVLFRPSQFCFPLVRSDKECFRRALTRVNKSEDDVELEKGREKRRIVEKVGTSFFQKNKKI